MLAWHGHALIHVAVLRNLGITLVRGTVSFGSSAGEGVADWGEDGGNA